MKNKILENNKNDIVEEIEKIVNFIKGKRFSGEVIYNNEKFVFFDGKAILHKEFVLRRLNGL